MFLARILLFPFAVLYDAVTGLRNTIYNSKIKPSVSFDVPVICVGNLAVGGTGKTPVIEYLIRLLGEKYAVGILSRGYKRKTTGFRIASQDDSATTLGDEPFQLFQKYGDKVKVAVGEDRAMAIPMMLQATEELNVILMDDGFQHRRVTPGFSIVLTDFNKPFYNDFLLPAGRLREARRNVQRGNIVVVTKCPATIDETTMQAITKRIATYTQNPVFFTTIQYGDLKAFGRDSYNAQRKVVLVTGIANANPLVSFVKAHFDLVEHLNFPDHYEYATPDLERMENVYKKDPSVIFITTEKDMVKLTDQQFKSFTSRLPFFYLPIEVGFVKGGKEFDKLVLHSITQRD